MRALFGDDPVCEHDDAVGHPGGLEAVRDHHSRPSPGDAAGSRGHAGLGGEVEIRGRLVQEQDRRIDELGTCERDELALTRREGAPPLGDRGLIAARELGDELVGTDGNCGGLDLVVARVGASIGDVVVDRAREQEALLRHVPELAPIGGKVIFTKVGPVD